MEKIKTRIEVVYNESINDILIRFGYTTNDGNIYINEDGERFKICAIHHHNWTDFISYIDLYPLD